MNKIAIFLLIFPLVCYCQVIVVGNLAVVANPHSHISLPHPRTLKVDIPNLWCGAQKLQEHVDVEYGEFTKLENGKVSVGVENQGKIYLEIGQNVSVNVVGRYRCEVRTLDKEIHSGNLIIYLPPVLNFPSFSNAKELPNAKPPHVIGAERKGFQNEKITLECPVLSNPEPLVRWEKDGEAIAPSNSTQFDGNNLILEPLNLEHSGKYRCIAENSFPLFVDGPSMPHLLQYDQTVKVL
ncbi:unnamed protein product [Caenorhabditis angaria]|uniref:Ig-like domain-containing protein n=1 Tax=Caenorhabditis angaria TaxID=860376 RepID=A0A9P1I6M4_9PELO|nr:unnamed protein product [Caenorhabditis angaria]